MISLNQLTIALYNITIMLEQIQFFILLTLGMAIAATPLKYPFLWMETFFHELSHGLTAILTFGWIHRIKLKWNGAGSCTTSGGLRIPILFMGYTGAVLWGAFIYLAGWYLGHEGIVELLYFLIGVLAICTVLWVRDVITLFIVLAMFGVFYIPTTMPEHTSLAWIIQFYGLYVLRSAITAPLALIDGQHVGDGAELSNKTLFFPEGFWILIWFLFGISTLFILWQWSTPEDFRFYEGWPFTLFKK